MNTRVAQNTPAQSAAAMIGANNQLRTMLLSSAPRMRKNLGTFTGGIAGGNTRVKLFNVGLTTRLILNVVMTIDIGTATATASAKAPFNLINRVKLTDFDGTDRVNVSGFQLATINSARYEMPYGYNNESQTSVLALPAVPTAVGASQNFQFLLEVPLAYSKDDLRGALLTQTAVGEAWLSLDWNSLLYSNGNADAVYNGAATSTVALSAGTTISVTVEQEYLLPQAVPDGKGGSLVPIPPLDVMTVYELNGALRSSDNLAAGQEKLINYPNARNVIGFYATYLNNGALNAPTTDWAKLRLIANGNNVLREYSPQTKLTDMRDRLGGDWRNATWFEMHRDLPIATAQYGNVQYGFTPAAYTAGASTNIEIAFESFYTKGSTLPGLNQGS